MKKWSYHEPNWDDLYIKTEIKIREIQRQIINIQHQILEGNTSNNIKEILGAMNKKFQNACQDQMEYWIKANSREISLGIDVTNKYDEKLRSLDEQLYSQLQNDE